MTLDELRKTDRYLTEKERQQRRAASASDSMVAARLCPFCRRKVAELAGGYAYGPERIKCGHCGEETMYPPTVVGGPQGWADNLAAAAAEA